MPRIMMNDLNEDFLLAVYRCKYIDRIEYWWVLRGLEFETD